MHIEPKCDVNQFIIGEPGIDIDSIANFIFKSMKIFPTQLVIQAVCDPAVSIVRQGLFLFCAHWSE